VSLNLLPAEDFKVVFLEENQKMLHCHRRFYQLYAQTPIQKFKQIVFSFYSKIFKKQIVN